MAAEWRSRCPPRACRSFLGSFDRVAGVSRLLHDYSRPTSPPNSSCVTGVRATACHGPFVRPHRRCDGRPESSRARPPQVARHLAAVDRNPPRHVAPQPDAATIARQRDAIARIAEWFQSDSRMHLGAWSGAHRRALAAHRELHPDGGGTVPSRPRSAAGTSIALRTRANHAEVATGPIHRAELPIAPGRGRPPRCWRATGASIARESMSSRPRCRSGVDSRRSRSMCASAHPPRWSCPSRDGPPSRIA